MKKWEENIEKYKKLKEEREWKRKNPDPVSINPGEAGIPDFDGMTEGQEAEAWARYEGLI